MTDESARMVAGRYRLDRVLGRGGMGAVWQGSDTLLDRDVAVKEIYLPGADSGPVDPADPRIRRAMREAQAAARLRHPSIVTVHDIALDAGRPWIIMELVNGPSLADVIEKSGPLPAGRSAEIGLQVLDALSTAHRHGTVHRDVKPANILIDTDRAMLTDFGIAAVDDATALTATGFMIGSPAYMAPERINGHPATPAGDLWALGVTIYTAVTGRSPFQREDTQGTIAAILTSPAVPVDAGHLWPVLAGLLEKDPARRLTAEQARPLLATSAREDVTLRYTPPAPPAPAFSAPPPFSAPPAPYQTPPPFPAPSFHQHGMLPADFPVQLVELTVGDRTGYTLRAHVPEQDGWTTPVFATSAGRLPLVPRPEQAAGFALASPEHDLSRIPHWGWLCQSMSRGYLPLLDANRYDLGLPAVNLEMDPARWLPDLLVKSGTIANELILALDIEEAFQLLAPGTPLDQLDDSLRQAGDRPRKNHIRQWQQLDRRMLAAWWQHVTDIIESRLDWRA
ncbi:serine/threonine-protein kinase [Actinoplanes sp. NBRC 103695]|uniref:serine/threonine-protein kinase n=1 Tax=Actinoplanes sp. NBRC 103695 TaxID=3032202 RepID=UPI0025521DFE|nr:serine/threonine-protein kinase [Actinoplanes sp. NBRC 103695]